MIKCLALVLIAGVTADMRAGTVAELGAARASFDNNRLTVTTGVVQREWQWTGKGLLTTSLRDVRSGKEWVKPNHHFSCDWSFPGNADTPGGIDGVLVGTETRMNDDDGFTGKFVETVSTIRYDAIHLEVQYVVWAF